MSRQPSGVTRRTSWPGAITGVVLAVATLAIASPAAAAPSLTVSPQGGVAGDQLTATGGGFAVGTVSLHVDAVPGTQVVGGIAVDAGGGFTAAFTIPNITAGPHTLIACLDNAGSRRAERAFADFRVIAPEPTTTTNPVSTIPPVVVQPPTTTTTIVPSVQIPTTTSPPPTVPPVIGSAAPPTAPPFPTLPGDVAISTTVPPPPLAAPHADGVVPDVYVTGIEATQGTQNLDSVMPLVAGRRTTVRVHVGASPFAIVDGALLVERNGAPDEVLLPDNGPIGSDNDRAEIDGALNFTLEPHQHAAGAVTFTVQVWSAGLFTAIDDEPNSANNTMTRPVEFVAGENPTVWLFLLDAEAAGGAASDPLELAFFAGLVQEGMLDFHPISGPIDFQVFPGVVGPGPESLVPGQWDLDVPKSTVVCPNSELSCKTGSQLKSEPNQRIRQLAEDAGIYNATDLYLGYFNSSVPTSPGGWASNGVAWSKPSAATAAHELGHQILPGHVICSGTETGSIDIAFPTALPPVCSLAPIDPDGYFGHFPYRNPSTNHSNDPAHPAAAWPYMGYYDGTKAPDPYHWCLMLGYYGVACNTNSIGVPPLFEDPVDLPEPETVDPGMDDLVIETGNWVLLSGTVDPATGTGSIAHASARSRDPDDEPSTRELDPPVDPHVRIIQIGAVGDVLLELPVLADPGDEGEVGGPSTFSAILPFVGEASELQLVVGDQVVDTVAIAQEAPIVTDLRVGTDDGSTTIGWYVSKPTIALDANGGDVDTTTFTVLWTADGRTWFPVATDVAAADLQAPPPADTPGDADSQGYFQFQVAAAARLPGGSDVRVRVVANAGVRAGEATSEPFSAPTHAPTAAIAGVPAAPVEQLNIIELHAIVFDPEDAAAGDGRDFLVWQRSTGEIIGTGPTLLTGDLPAGVHTIELLAFDADGNPATAAVDIRIVERSSPTRRDEDLDPGVVELLVDVDLATVPTTQATSQATMPGGQSCGSNECVGDFIAACEDAGGLAVDVGPDPPSPDGVEVECQQVSTQPA